MELTRRNFVKSTAVAMATAAAAGTAVSFAGCSPSSGGTNTGGGGGDSSMVADQTYTAVCRYCGVGCGVLVGVKDGVIISVEGDPENQSNLGALCIKGQSLAQLLYADDRLTVPLIRDDKSTKGTDGGLREATWEEALDLVAEKLKATWQTDKTRMAFWASGQLPITDGYVLAKFWKAGLLSNNIDPNARLCMASAVVAFMNVFSTDEPANCYADIDEADVFITWGANMYEAHPVLYQRLVGRKNTDTNVKHYDLGTIKTRTSEGAKTLIFNPGTDIAIANCICNYLVANQLYDEAFVSDHLKFQTGMTDLGNAFEDGYDGTDVIKNSGTTAESSLEEFASLVAPYTFEYTAELSGVAAADLEELAKLFADKSLKIMSFWTMGVNQHNRGTWMNHCIYNAHLLAGKYAQPGCGAFSLTGQPTACGTAREVGTFSHRLPADLVVANEAHRRYTEAVWDLPEGYLDEIQANGPHTVKIFRDMSSGKYDFFWSTCNNWAVSMPNLTRFLGKGDKKGIIDTFVVVNEVYPTLSCQYADVVLPAAMWVEREGQFGNAERRTSVFEKAVDPPGEAKWDMWIILQVARRVLDGAKIGEEDAFSKLFGFIWEGDDFKADARETCKAVWEEYRIFSNPSMKASVEALNTESKLKMEAKQLAPYDEYLTNHGLLWPVREVDGKWLGTSWRFNAGGPQEAGYDAVGVETYGEAGKAGDLSFYKTAGMKPAVCFRPYEPPALSPDDEYPFWFVTGRLLEQWHTGSNTTRIPDLNNTLPEALLYINDADASALGIASGDNVRVTSQYGTFEIKATTDKRVEPPAGRVFAPFFSTDNLINLAVEDIYCPLSKEPDYKKTPVKIEKA